MGRTVNVSSQRGTRRERKQRHKIPAGHGAKFISNNISALFGDSLAKAKKALALLGPLSSHAASKFSPKMKQNKKTTAQKRADLVRKAEREGIKLRTYKPKKKKGPR